MPNSPLTDSAFKAEIDRRALLIDRCKRSDRLRKDCLAAARADPVIWCNNWCWTFDPRNRAEPWQPFVLWPRQAEYLNWLRERFEQQEEFLVEKSRDVGISWLNMVFAVHGWLWSEGFAAGFGANKTESVDGLGNPKSLLEKGRMLLRRLPAWQKPEGFRVHDQCMHMRFVHPTNGNVIVGEAGDNMGRGGRAAIYFLDEAAHIERADAVDAATIANADCRGWIISFSCMGNTFARKRHSGDVPVFSFHWKDDPRKDDEWAARTQLRTEPWIFAAEYNLDYGAAMEGLICLKAWIDAAVELGERINWPRSEGSAVAGLDVGGGKARSVLIVRDGPLILEPVDWREPDTIDTANKALASAREQGAAVLNFDAIGVGQGPLAVFKRREPDDLLRIKPINVGAPASKNRVWEDGRTSDQWFKNLKAEGWWLLRRRLKASYELLKFFKSEAGGVHHPLEDCLLLPNHNRLRTECNIPRWFTTETSKIIVESKEQLARRSIPSPDFADALVLTLITPQLELWTPDMLAEGEAPIMSPGVEW